MLLVLKILNFRTTIMIRMNRGVGLTYLTRLEVFEMLRWNLSYLKEADATIIVNEGTTLDIGLGLVRDLHQELRTRVNHVLKDLVIDYGTKIVRVGDEEVLLAVRDKLIKNTRVKKGVVEIAVPGRVPVLLVVVRGARAGEESLLEDTRVARLVESRDPQLLVRVLLDNAKRVVVGVEGGHEHEWHIDLARGIEVLDLTHGQVEEGHVVLDLKGRLGTSHT
jgi:hypothetical protein